MTIMTSFSSKPNLLPLIHHVPRSTVVGLLQHHCCARSPPNEGEKPLLLMQLVRLLSGKAAAQTGIPTPDLAEGSRLSVMA